jgi:hypothetical protein
MNLTKPIGWLIFFFGLSIILFTIYQSFVIFTGKSPPPELFKPSEKEIALQKKKVPTSLEELQKQIGEILAEQLREIFPIESITKILNLISWSILAGILIFGGSQISSLGIKLLR